jgi:hypothetical protein
MEKLGLREAEEPLEVAGQAIGLALGIDPLLASRLSPQSLASLLELSGLDAGVIELVVQAIELEGESLEARDETTPARFRRDQADAVRSLLEAERESRPEHEAKTHLTRSDNSR